MNMEILEEFSASNDHIIAKGKRTKRPRSDSSSAAADFNCINSSPATSISTSTEEDEDLANCLILLARGQTEISSRKFAELATTTTAAKVGIFVYECKTCSRTFPSFQALGGHRASHKRPKIDREKEEADNEHRSKLGNLNTTIAPPPSTPPQLLAHVESKAKIHECSICGSEFASGQALGGHMRRHRSGPNTAAGRSDGDHSPSHDHRRAVLVEKTRSMLALDLNLPAPAEEAEFRGFSSKQQPRIIFPAAALVDCHY